jgi:hypothetical protein
MLARGKLCVVPGGLLETLGALLPTKLHSLPSKLSPFFIEIGIREYVKGDRNELRDAITNASPRIPLRTPPPLELE